MRLHHAFSGKAFTLDWVSSFVSSAGGIAGVVLDSNYRGSAATTSDVKALLTADGHRADLIGQRTGELAGTFYRVGDKIFCPKINFIPCDGTEFSFVDSGDAGDDDADFRVLSGDIDAWDDGIVASAWVAVTNFMGSISPGEIGKYRCVYSVDYTTPTTDDYFVFGTMVPRSDEVNVSYGAHCYRYANPARTGVTSEALNSGSFSQTIIQSWVHPEISPREAAHTIQRTSDGNVLLSQGVAVPRDGSTGSTPALGSSGAYTGALSDTLLAGERRPYCEATRGAGSDTTWTIHGAYLLGDLPLRGVS